MRSATIIKRSKIWKVLQQLFILTGREHTDCPHDGGIPLSPDKRSKYKRTRLATHLRNPITFADLATELRAVRHRRRKQPPGTKTNYAKHGATPGEHACLTLRYDDEAKKGATFFKSIRPEHYGAKKQKHDRKKENTTKHNIKKVNACIEEIVSAQEHGEFAIADCGDDKSGWGIFNGYKTKHACPFLGMSCDPFACTALKDAIGLPRGAKENCGCCSLEHHPRQRDFLRHGKGDPVLAEFTNVASKENDATMTNSDPAPGKPLLDADGNAKAFQSQVFVHTATRGEELRLMGGIVQYINHACKRCATHAQYNWTAESPDHEGKKRLPIVQRWPVLLPGVQITLCYGNGDKDLKCMGPFCRPDQWIGIPYGVYDDTVLVPKPLEFTNGCSSAGIDKKLDEKTWYKDDYEFTAEEKIGTIGTFLPNSIAHVPACLRSHPWRPKWYDYIKSSWSSSLKKPQRLSRPPDKVLITPGIMELVSEEWRQSDSFKKMFKFSLGNGLALRPSTCVGGGMGLFATREIKKGEWITFYDGVALVDHGSSEHTDRDCWKKSLGQNSPIIVGFTSSDFMADPLNEEWLHAGVMSLCNSSLWSSNQITRNATEQKWLQKTSISWKGKLMPIGDVLPVLQALKTIQPDEEIFWRYDPNYKEL